MLLISPPASVSGKACYRAIKRISGRLFFYLFGFIPHPIIFLFMNQKDLNRLNMWKAVYAILQQYKDVWKGNAPFSAAVDELKALIDAAGEADKKQKAGKTTGITKDKESLADIAIASTTKVTKVARAYALKERDHKLYAAVNYDKGILDNTPLDELEARLQGMLDAALTVKDKLGDYGLPERADTDAAAAIEEFKKETPATRAAIAGRKAVTGSVPDIIRAGRQKLLFMDDLVHLYDEPPAFASTYKAARVIVNAGGRHEDEAA